MEKLPAEARIVSLQEDLTPGSISSFEDDVGRAVGARGCRVSILFVVSEYFCYQHGRDVKVLVDRHVESRHRFRLVWNQENNYLTQQFRSSRGNAVLHISFAIIVWYSLLYEF